MRSSIMSDDESIPFISQYDVLEVVVIYTFRSFHSDQIPFFGHLISLVDPKSATSVQTLMFSSFPSRQAHGTTHVI